MKVQREVRTLYQISDLSESDFAYILSALGSMVERHKAKLQTETDVQLRDSLQTGIDNATRLMNELLAYPR